MVDNIHAQLTTTSHGAQAMQTKAFCVSTDETLTINGVAVTMPFVDLVDFEVAAINWWVEAPRRSPNWLCIEA